MAIEHSDGELEPLNLTPQDWGLPEKPTFVQQRTWDTQQRFLKRFAERGKLALSAADVGISPMALHKWQNSDKYNFQKRFELAYQSYRETQEELNEEWVRETKHNSQIYRIFHMKAIWPEKYRDDVKPQSTDAGRQLLDRLTEMARREIEERKRLEAEATDGEFRELDGQG
jgi:tRNA A37 N6-isopentenylltransferase MiaA